MADPASRDVTIADALAMWHAAQEYFQNVSDPDLIEYAIYDLEAAKRRYMYLLKRVRIQEEADIPVKSTMEDRNAI